MNKDLLVKKFQSCAVPAITIKNLFNLDDLHAGQLITAIQNILDIANKKGFPSPLVLGVHDMAAPEEDAIPIQCLQGPTGMHCLRIKDNKAICTYCTETFFLEG